MSKNKSRAQSLVELALTVPVLMTLALFSVDIGRAFYYKEAVTNADRQALRAATLSTYKGMGNNVCSNYGGISSTTLPAASTSPIASIADIVALEGSTNGTPSGSVLNGGTLTLKWHCKSGVALTNTTATRIDPTNSDSASIEAFVSFDMPLMTSYVTQFLGSSTLTLSSDLYGRAQY